MIKLLFLLFFGSFAWLFYEAMHAQEIDDDGNIIDRKDDEKDND